MDRRQKKSREAILAAFSELLSHKSYHKITVGQIIEQADVGRATFYAHFETKDFLLKELCEELFCHIFDATEAGEKTHKHMFDCDAPASVILHLLQHLQRNDHHIRDLLVCEDNELFVRYFKESLCALLQAHPTLRRSEKADRLPESYRLHLVSSSLVETVRWWLANGMRESPEVIADYFLTAIS